MTVVQIPGLQIPDGIVVDVRGITIYPGYCMSWECHQPATDQWPSDGGVLWAVCSEHRTDPLITPSDYVTVL